MEQLYIKIENNQPVNHPILSSNLELVLGYKINATQVPEGYMVFIRSNKPIIGVYEVYEGSNYSIVNGYCTQVHNIRNMTEQEKLAKQNTVKADWSNSSGYASWIFDENSCSFIPPVNYPTDGNLYIWNEDTISWQEIQRPN